MDKNTYIAIVFLLLDLASGQEHEQKLQKDFLSAWHGCQLDEQPDSQDCQKVEELRDKLAGGDAGPVIEEFIAAWQDCDNAGNPDAQVCQLADKLHDKLGEELHRENAVYR